jgi:transposase InsO family protein
MMTIISYQLHEPEASAMSRARSTAERSSRPLTLAGLEATREVIRETAIELEKFFLNNATSILTDSAPEIFNTDQGSQFTSDDFTGLLKKHDIAISMDGRGRAQDNIFIERLWWTLKYNYIYLRSFDNGAVLRRGIRGWFSFYNQERFHQALDNLTPDEVYYGLPHPFAEAA